VIEKMAPVVANKGKAALKGKSPAAVCFRKRNDDVVTFDAKRTRSPCRKQWDQFNVVQKTTNMKELEALTKLKQQGAHRVPRLLYGKPKSGNRAEVRMTKVGTSLTDMGGRRGGGGKALVKRNKRLLEDDLRKAMHTMKAAAILHQDMAPRNVTWDGQHFNVIDFDIVDFRNDWDIDSEVEEAMDVIMAWADKS
jgi:tRNA A-37 threonylcarbamoyl transferase component Bud32